MDTARAEQIINELKYITSTIYTGHVAEFKPSATLLERRIKPSELPFIKKDASGQALYYIIQGRAGVDIGKKERIMIFPRQSVGEISMISTVLNTFNNLGNLESRCADVYAEEPLQLLVYNYSGLVEIMRESSAAFRKYRQHVLVSLNRIMYRKLMEVNNNYVDVLVNYGQTGDNHETDFIMPIEDGLSRFFKKMRTFPNISISPHELRGILIREGESNPPMTFIEKGKVKISMLAADKDNGVEEMIELDKVIGPMVIGESSILNVDAISTAQVSTLEKVIGYRMPAQKLLRLLQNYPDMSEDFFKLLLALNYFRTTNMIQKTNHL